MTRFLPLLAAALRASCASEEPAVLANDQEAAAPPPAVQPADAPAPETLAPLTPEGWGPLRIGMTLQQVTDALGPDADPEAVGGPDPESCDQFRPQRAPRGMLVMIENGRLTSIALIDDSEVKTDKGLGLGIPSAQVVESYGAAATVTPHKYQDPPAAYITIWSKGGGKAYVEDEAARGLVYEVDEQGKVAVIHAGGPSIQYVEGCA